MRGANRLRRCLANAGLMMVTCLAFALVLELALRLTGFSFRLAPDSIEFGQPDPVMIADAFREDPELFWVTPDYQEKLARYRTSPPRLLFQGDSCTHLGRYDAALAAKVADRHPGQRLAYGNLGVAGWSSYQGLRQLQRDIVPLRPRVVTIYFGWNDHWIGFGIEDKEVGALRRGLGVERWQRVRLVQLLTKARLAVRSRDAAFPNRVSRVDFEANLRQMVTVATAAGVTPMLITAPSSHVVGDEPAYLGERWLRDLGDLVPVHQAYVAAVRTVAASTRAELCDVAAAFDALALTERRALMMADGIHLTPAGDARLASMLYDCLDTAGLLAAVVVTDEVGSNPTAPAP